MQPISNYRYDAGVNQLCIYDRAFAVYTDIAVMRSRQLDSVMKSLVVKRSVVIAGHKTSVSIEEAFWRSLKEIAGARSMGLSDLITTINCDRDYGNLSSAIRLFVLKVYREQLDLQDYGQKAIEQAIDRFSVGFS
jgi:predicted DNA-binding ribbon-helix-helix protein